MMWLDVALRVAVVSQLVFTCVLLARAGWPPSLARALAMWLSAATAAYIYCSAPVTHPHPFTWVTAPVIILCIVNPVVFWLFACAVFEDGFRLRAWHVAVLAGFVALALAPGRWMNSGDIYQHPILTLSHRLVAMSFVLTGLWVAFRGREADLLEGRRRLRGWLTVVVGIYMLIIVAVEVALMGRQAPDILSVLNVAAILVITHVTCHGLTVVDAQVLDPAVSGSPIKRISVSQRELLNRLRGEIERNHVYRHEGLSIAHLAEKLDTQEYLLRRVINYGLGFRNFNEFLHSYRIREACERLRQTEDRKLPVLTIALEVGYSSIGPFNRAFKELTGKTPTEYRQLHRRNGEVPVEKT